MWHTQHVSMKATLLKMMFRFGLFNPNNTRARGATLLCCSLFLVISVNNTQSIVCGGLEKHLPWPSGGDPVYIIEAAVSNQCLSGILHCHLLHPNRPPKHTPTHTLQESGVGFHQSMYFVRKLLKRGVKTPSLILCQIRIFRLAPDQRNSGTRNSHSSVLACIGLMM